MRQINGNSKICEEKNCKWLELSDIGAHCKYSNKAVDKIRICQLKID